MATDECFIVFTRCRALPSTGLYSSDLYTSLMTNWSECAKQGIRRQGTSMGSDMSISSSSSPFFSSFFIVSFFIHFCFFFFTTTSSLLNHSPFLKQLDSFRHVSPIVCYD